MDPGSAQASAVVHGDGLTSLQYRKEAGKDTEEIRLPISGADQVQLERKGGTYIMSAARFGEPYASERVEGIDLGDEVLVGLFVCSHNAEVVEKARFTNVRITIPAAENFVPYQDYIGGTIELLDVDTGRRTAVFRSDRPIQAPNWTKDGRFLIYNVDGLLYRFELATGRTSKIDTGFATANNNDHVLSFDGKRLGISHHSAEDKDESIIYTLPVKGGTPKRVTSKAPSYLHGWSPDGRFLVYTGGRSENFDVYRIPVKGGDEVRLTDAPGPRRRTGVHAGRPLHLFQFRPDRRHEDLADGPGRERPGARHGGRIPRLVPPRLPRRPADRLLIVRQGRRSGRPSVL